MRKSFAMQLILHIGTEKTGTTTIQNFIYENKTVLERNGIGLLNCFDKPTNRKLAAFCSPPDLFDEYFLDRRINTQVAKNAHFARLKTEFKSEIEHLPSHIKTVFITSEHLHSRLLDISSIKRVHDFFTPFFAEIKIICYFREQSEVAKSLYTTFIRCGATFDFATHLKACHPRNDYYNYHSFFSRWGIIFGKGNLIPRIYNKKFWVGNDIRKDLLSIIDQNIDYSELIFQQKDLNIQLGALGLQLGRINNIINPYYHSDGSRNLNQLRVLNTIADSFVGYHGKLEFFDADRIFDSFNESNILFAQQFLGQPSNPFFRPSLKPEAALINTSDNFNFDSTDLLTLFEKLLRAMSGPAKRETL